MSETMTATPGIDMTERLYRLVYHSRNRITGSPSEVLAEIDSILRASQRNNTRLGVTGALVFNSGFFAQALEGDCSAIEKVFEKIQHDPRHGDVQILAYNPAIERVFPNWSMAYLGQSREHQDLFGHIGRDTGFTTARIEGQRLLDVVRGLAFEQETRAA
jgi:hypothetical protein